MQIEGKFQIIPDVSHEDVVTGDETTIVNFCNILVMDVNGVPFIANASYQKNYKNPVEITSGFYSAIEVISKEIKNKELQLLTFADQSSVNMINLALEGMNFKICVEPSLEADWLLPHYIRSIIDKDIDLFSNSPDLVSATTAFYKKLNIDIHKGTVSTLLYVQSGCWKEEDAAVMSPSGFIGFNPQTPEDVKKYVESRKAILSALVEAGARGAVQLDDSQGSIRMEYTLQLYHIQGSLRNF